MPDVQESYPTQTTGLLTPTEIVLTGSGLSALVTARRYKVTLSLGGTSSVAVTAAAKDIAGADPSYTGSFHWVARNAAPLTANSGDVVESYPVSTSGVVANIASFNSDKSVAALTSTANPPTVYAHTVGEALIECFVPSFDVNGANDYTKGGVYTELIVIVTP